MSIEIITSIATALLSGGGITYLLMFKENKKSKQLSNDSSQQEVYMGLLSAMEKQIAINKDLVSENTDLRRERDDLKVENRILKAFKCEHIYCDNRRPPLETFTESKPKEDEGHE